MTDFKLVFNNMNQILMMAKCFELFQELFDIVNIKINNSNILIKSPDKSQTLYVEFQIKSLEEDSSDKSFTDINISTEHLCQVFKLINKGCNSIIMLKYTNENILHIIYNEHLETKTLLSDNELYRPEQPIPKADGKFIMESSILKDIFDHLSKMKTIGTNCSISLNYEKNPRIIFESHGNCSFKFNEYVNIPTKIEFSESYSIKNLLLIHKLLPLFENIEFNIIGHSMLMFHFNELNVDLKLFISPLIKEEGLPS